MPFDVSIPEEERDSKLKKHLKMPELAGEAIQACAVSLPLL